MLNESPLTTRELVDRVASQTLEKPIQQLQSDERKRIHVSLYQVHLPTLEDHGVIVKANREWYLGEPVEEIKPYLEVDNPGFLQRLGIS